MFTKAFLTALLERAVKAFTSSLAALLTADGTDLLNTDWGDRLSVSGMAALVTVLLAVASGAATGSPSAFRVEIPAGNVVAVTSSKGVGTVAGPASPLANDTPVTVEPAGDGPDDPFGH